MFPGLDPRQPNGPMDALYEGLAAATAPDEPDEPDPEPEPPPRRPKPGRGSDGRFAEGNSGGPGNPFARQVARFRQALYEAVSEDMLKDLAARLWGMSIGGNVAAARLLLQYLVGKPQDPPNPDRLDQDEWQAYQAEAVPPAEFCRQMESVPAYWACGMAEGVWPIYFDCAVHQPVRELFRNPNRRPQTDEDQPARQAPSPNGDNGAVAQGPATAVPEPTPQPAREPADVGRRQTPANGGPAPARERPVWSARPGNTAATARAPSTNGGPAHPRPAARDADAEPEPDDLESEPPSQTATTVAQAGRKAARRPPGPSAGP